MDRFFRGLVAGIIGGVVMNIWSLISFNILHFTDKRFLDWAAVMLYGQLSGGLFEEIMALMAQILFVGFLGILFAFFIPHVTSRGYILKGLFYGFITGFFIYAIPVLFKTPFLYKTDFPTAVSNLIGGLLWGLTLALTLHWFDLREKKR